MKEHPYLIIYEDNGETVMKGFDSYNKIMLFITSFAAKSVDGNENPPLVYENITLSVYDHCIEKLKAIMGDSEAENA